MNRYVIAFNSVKDQWDVLDNAQGFAVHSSFLRLVDAMNRADTLNGGKSDFDNERMVIVADSLGRTIKREGDEALARISAAAPIARRCRAFVHSCWHLTPWGIGVGSTAVSVTSDTNAKLNVMMHMLVHVRSMAWAQGFGPSFDEHLCRLLMTPPGAGVVNEPGAHR